MRPAPLAALFWLAAEAASGACAPDIVEIRTPRGSVAFAVEIADTDEERARGLMFRTNLPSDAGMLFLFDGEAPRVFWMKNTPIPLDMLHFDGRGRLCGIVDRAEPFSLTPRETGCSARAVLEINGGLAARLGLTQGAEMRHPAFGPGAAWPCE